ncbi:hypothetical protein N9165_00360 [Akkermansiaceae bacterium]|nr:hypothetical protein [Akkermansiaceae bacterium]
MPIKYKDSTSDRKGNMIHTYIHTVSTEELTTALENDNTAPKLKQKISNELVKRQPKAPSKGWHRAVFP